MIKSYCKINLSLNIIKKLKSVFHDIQSNNFLLNIYDEIEIKKNSKKDTFSFTGKFSKYIDRSNNSVIKTFKFLRDKRIIKRNEHYNISIKKKIPVFSGLGGGTSNAFYIAKYFLKSKLMKYVGSLEKSVGSDLKLFLHKQSFQQNLGNIKKYKFFFKYHIIVLYPNIKCSTKFIYSKVKNFNNPTHIKFSNISSKNKFLSLIKKEQNDLEEIVTNKHTIIRRVCNFISIQKGCHFARVTGSGSAVFGIFKSKKLAILGLKNIKKKFSKKWCVITKTI